MSGDGWRPGWRLRWRVRWAKWRRRAAKCVEELASWWRRHWPRWRAAVAERAPAWATWGLVAAAWGFTTWAAVDAVPAAWEATVLKVSGGLLAAGLVGTRLWGKLLGYGVYLLRDLGDEIEEGGGR